MLLQETRNYNVSTIPNEFNFPNKISLNYINSDAFRLCIEEKVFESHQINEFLENEKYLFENRFVNILPNLKVEGSLKRGSFEESLKWNGDITDMNDEKPIKVIHFLHAPKKWLDLR